ncbi:hypothetical protein J4460_00820 [Candidatus Woesearchaeota archaeon]|nr:MAG: hypothetical protein QS99_C0002G0022 [archaeon GW2011_AR4]MBS3129193.1 hypothetical protein [Candidatus Woesearchaeota archaeon]HIH39048.1 hypothetical protein [Candidatus Woesearchaeota archaeon]HIH49806.1 hypothetical protein [Candidatus Woesearchaeota archaeon]HIJ04053.1 hypothetical protein [Candidatus Woesearchaeota archaeon]
MIHISTLLKYYKRQDIQKEMAENAKGREIAVKYGEKGFGKRPDILNYEAEILEFVKKGATSFHASEEHWDNPLSLTTSMNKREVEELRIGWDLIIDIDCNVWDYTKLSAVMLIQALKYHGIQAVSIKFSGNKGFHIGVPFESFPKTINNQPIESLFPDAPRAIAAYLQEMTRSHLSKAILKTDNIETIAKKSGMNPKEFIINNAFDPYKIVGIDTILISQRHLFRMPYSLHEKSGLASLPILLEQVMDFDKGLANPENIVVPNHRFLDKQQARSEEARSLIIQALDATAKLEETKEKNEQKEFIIPEVALPEEAFPPCMHLIFKGINDGKKRAVFALVNFLQSIGWSYDMIEQRLLEWNKKNPEPLRETILLGQIRYHKQNKKSMLPPNCDNQMYYIDIGVCKPDNLCAKIKNPVHYTLRKAGKQKKPGKTKSSSRGTTTQTPKQENA